MPALFSDEALVPALERLGIPQEDARGFTHFDQVMEAFAAHLDSMAGATVRQVLDTLDTRHCIAPVPLLSALIEGSLEQRRDMTEGGAKYRTFGIPAQGAAHAIDSLVALETVIFQQRRATMAQVCEALDADFVGHENLRAALPAAPKYGNDDEQADALGRRTKGAAGQEAARYRASAGQRLDSGSLRPRVDGPLQ